jgi:putative ATP-binding cassette transporter
MLDQVRRWDRVLSDGEQQGLAFARALLHAPRWVIIDEALETLEDDMSQRVSEVFIKDLAHTGVIYIGHTAARNHLFERVLHLVKDPEGHCLVAQRTLDTA